MVVPVLYTLGALNPFDCSKVFLKEQKKAYELEYFLYTNNNQKKRQVKLATNWTCHLRTIHYFDT